MRLPQHLSETQPRNINDLYGMLRAWAITRLIRRPLVRVQRQGRRSTAAPDRTHQRTTRARLRGLLGVGLSPTTRALGLACCGTARLSVGMADDVDADAYIPTVLYCLDGKGVDRLLVRLRTVHGESGRADIAPELRRATRTQQAARERVASASP
jgi:hypothetical protein